MKNILDKRQLSYKLTANSLYGQCGARTSTFYDKDVNINNNYRKNVVNLCKKLIEESYYDVVLDTMEKFMHMLNNM